MNKSIKIGKSDVTSKPLGLGTNKVGGHNLFPNLQDANGYAVVEEALDQGIDLLDTAYVYGLGRSEEIIGDVIKNYSREKIVLATKAAHDPDQDLAINNSPAFLKESVDQALMRLKTDYIDIFFIHFPDEHTQKAEAVNALAEMKQAGKIRAIGLSNFSLDQIKEANQDGNVDIVENNYSLVQRDDEADVFPYLHENQISFIPYFPLASGILTGKHSFESAKELNKYTVDSGFTDRLFSDDQLKNILSSVDLIKDLAKKYSATTAQMVLAWYIKNPDISIVIPGARIPEQVDQNAQALNIDLSDQDYQTIDQAFSAKV